MCTESFYIQDKALKNYKNYTSNSKPYFCKIKCSIIAGAGHLGAGDYDTLNYQIIVIGNLILSLIAGFELYARLKKYPRYLLFKHRKSSVNTKWLNRY